MRIVLDAMGSDTCPEPEVLAAVESARLFGDEIILVGPIDDLKTRLDKLRCTQQIDPPGRCNRDHLHV